MFNKADDLLYEVTVMNEAWLNDRFEAVMDAAKQSGLLGDKSRRLGVRVSPKLVEQAKSRTGISADTDLVEYALASLAIDEPYGFVLEELRGTVDPDIDLDF